MLILNNKLIVILATSLHYLH